MSGSWQAPSPLQHICVHVSLHVAHINPFFASCACPDKRSGLGALGLLVCPGKFGLAVLVGVARTVPPAGCKGSTHGGPTHSHPRLLVKECTARPAAAPTLRFFALVFHTTCRRASWRRLRPSCRSRSLDSKAPHTTWSCPRCCSTPPVREGGGGQLEVARFAAAHTRLVHVGAHSSTAAKLHFALQVAFLTMLDMLGCCWGVLPQ